MQNLFIGASSLLALVSYIVYIVAIFKGQAKPHRTTRFVMVIIASLATASLLAQGSTVAIWLSGIFTVGCYAIFLLSLKFGMGGWEKVDIICLLLSLAGIAFWKLTRDPVYGLLASIGADLVGQIPMLIKTYRFPETEVWTFYALDVAAALLTLLAVRQWTIQEFTFPLYIVAIDLSTVLLILRPRTAKIE